MKQKLIIIIALLLTSVTLFAANMSIRWDPSPASENIIKYNVYLAVGASTNYTLAGSTTNTTFVTTNLNVGVYKWKVAAVNEWGEGPLSAAISSSASLPSAPVGVSF